MASIPAKGRRPETPRMLRAEEFDSMIADYVAGDLDASDNERFELALLANPAWADAVEAEQLLRAGMRELGHSEPGLWRAPSAATTETPKVSVLPVKRRLPRSTWISGGWALAATLGGAALLWNAEQRIDHLQQALHTAEAPQGGISVLRLDAMRSIDPQRPSLQLEPGRRTVLVEVPEGPNPIPAYRVRVLSGDAVVADVYPAVATPDGVVLITLPAALLRSGSYQAVLTAPGEGAPLGSYAFEVSESR